MRAWWSRFWRGERKTRSWGRGEGEDGKTLSSGEDKTLSFGGEGFDFRRVADVDDATVAAFFATTHEQSRRMPLLIAGQVAAELEDRLTRAERLDAQEMSEIRGGLRALRQFATYYQGGIAAWEVRRVRRGAEEGAE